jgi:hypothetical protein
MTTPKAGWYPDPIGGPQQRFFDGVQWTDHYAPKVETASLAPPQGAPRPSVQPKADPSAWNPTLSSPTEFLSPPEEVQRKRNPLFLVLAVLSAIPTAICGFLYIFGSQADIVGLGLIWSFMWTWVWWALSDRYR